MQLPFRVFSFADFGGDGRNFLLQISKTKRKMEKVCISSVLNEDRGYPAFVVMNYFERYCLKLKEYFENNLKCKKRKA